MMTFKDGYTKNRDTERQDLQYQCISRASDLRYPDTHASCHVGIAIRIGYADTPPIWYRGVSEKKKILSI
jgi:hypothetical protein